MAETGLKRRNVAAAATNSTLGGERHNSSNNELGNSANNEGGDHDENENLEENEEFDADSKQTRLTLMEEILLLGLKDKEVIPHKINKSYYTFIKTYSNIHKMSLDHILIFYFIKSFKDKNVK